MQEADRFGAPDRMARSIFEKLRTSPTPALRRSLGDLRFFMEHAVQEGLEGQVYFRTQREFQPVLQKVSGYRRALEREAAKESGANFPPRLILREVLGLAEVKTPVQKIDDRNIRLLLPMID